LVLRSDFDVKIVDNEYLFILLVHFFRVGLLVFGAQTIEGLCAAEGSIGEFGFVDVQIRSVVA
jgi:hypothetical protein